MTEMGFFYMLLDWVNTTTCWRRGSVFRTSVFGWRTFHDICLIYGWHVTISWVKCLLWVNQPGQLSLHPLRVGN